MSDDSGIVYKMNASAPFEFYEKRQNIIKEMVVAIEHKNIIREQLAQCARDETVNQFKIAESWLRSTWPFRKTGTTERFSPKAMNQKTEGT